MLLEALWNLYHVVKAFLARKVTISELRRAVKAVEETIE
jgi:hypothetical protein